MKGWYVNRVVEHATHGCRRCGKPLAWVDQVGWVVVLPDDSSYDMCEADAYGNHLADPLQSPAALHP
jgi:hypothetical protein